MVYLLPLVGIVVVVLRSQKKFLLFLSYLVLSILIINNLLVGKIYLSETRRLSSLIRNVLISYNGEKIDICHDPRFNLDIYFYNLGVKVNSSITEICDSSEWKDISSFLKINPFFDNNSAWKDVISYLKIKDNNLDRTILPRIKLYPFTVFKGNDFTYTFNKNGSGVPFLYFGWSLPEEWGVWSIDREPKITLIGLPYGMDIKLTITLQRYTPKNSFSQQPINIMVNGVQLATWLLENKKKDYDLIIPKIVIQQKDTSILSFVLGRPLEQLDNNYTPAVKIGIISIRVNNPPPEE